MMDCENNVSFLYGLVSGEHIFNMYRLLFVRNRTQNCCCNDRKQSKTQLQSEGQHSLGLAFCEVHVSVPVVDVKQ
jgi:hypothetical protein